MVALEQPTSELIPVAGPTSAPAEAPGSLVPTFLLSFGTLVLVITITRLLRRTTRRHRQQPLETPRERIDRVRTEANASREPLLDIMAEASELSLRLAKSLDAKAARLELLIEQADARIAQLEQAAANRVQAAHAPTRRNSELSSPADLDAQILRLAREGCSSDQIARRLSRSVGEVELTLALHRSSNPDAA